MFDLFDAPKININLKINKILKHYKIDEEQIAIQINANLVGMNSLGSEALFITCEQENVGYILRKKRWLEYGDYSFQGIAFFDNEENKAIKKQLAEIAEECFGKFVKKDQKKDDPIDIFNDLFRGASKTK